jgi:hypothetical protein
MFFRKVLFRYGAALLTLGIFFFNAGFSAFAAGKKQPETAITRADALIRAKNYSEAIQVLTDAARNDPEVFDQAQRRVREVMILMGGFTRLANEMIDIVERNPENLPDILSISSQLSAMNAARRIDIDQFISNIEQVARLTLNRRELERILQEGGELLSQRRYLAALRMYQSGFELYQEQMYRAGYGDEINDITRSALGRIDDFISQAQTIIDFFDNLRPSIVSFGGSTQDAQTMLSVYNTIIPYFDNLIEYKRDIANTMRFFNEQDAISEIAEVQNEGRFFFRMAAVFIQGRTTEAIREGILGSIDAIWDIAAAPLEQSFTETAKAYFSQINDLMSREAFGSALASLGNLNNFNRGSLDLIGKWTSFNAPDANTELVLGQAVTANQIPNFLYFTGLEELARYLSTGAEEGVRFLATRSAAESENLPAAWRQGSISAEEAVSREIAWRRDYETYAGTLNLVLDELNREAARRQEALPAGEDGGGARADIRLFGEARRTLEALRDKLLEAPVQAAFEQYTIANGELDRTLSRLESSFDRDINMLEGTALILEDGSEITAFYPREAAELSTEIDRDIQVQIEAGRQLLEDYQGESGAVARSRQINELASAARSISTRIANLQAENNEARATALARVRRAEELLAEGRNLAENARSALAGANFDTAQAEAERSLGRYNDSLAIQESAEVRGEIASVINPLVAEIVQLRYEMIVREVRELVTNARERYFEGRFEQAEETLMRASERWNTISLEMDTEVGYWLNLVRGALFTRGGRTLASTAPLYPEISQLLSSARRNYDEGVRLLNNNRREDGLQMFAAAKQKTQEVRLLFPVNQDAGFLELQIEQMSDPAVFNQNFARRFQSALTGIRQGSFESYVDLQNLARLNPRYPGISAALAQAEIDLGIRPAPPDPLRLSRSNELAAAAQRMFSANIRSQYPIVLENVNEALRLNPNNTLAMQIKDRVQVAMGSASSGDSRTEQEYLRAVRELQNGNNLLALSIVQRLLQNPENRDSARLNELLRRIQASM